MSEFSCPYCHTPLHEEPGTLVICGHCGRAVQLPETDLTEPPEPLRHETDATGDTDETDKTDKTPPQAAHTAFELAEAEQKRARWSLLRLIAAGVQIILIAAGLCYPSMITEHPRLIWVWVLVPAISAAVISGLRPDDAFLEQPPHPRSRLMLFIFLLSALLLGTALFSVLLFGMQELLTGNYL